MCGLRSNFAVMKCEQKWSTSLVALAHPVALFWIPPYFTFHSLNTWPYEAPGKEQKHKVEKSQSLNGHIEQNHLINTNICLAFYMNKK